MRKNPKSEKRKSANQLMIDNYKLVFTSPEGQKVLADLLKNIQYASDVFVSEDTHKNAYLQGKQSVGVYIMNKLNKE